MKERLYINGNEVDIIPNQISRKIRVAELGNISSKLSSFSQQFKLPKTVRNKKVFEMLGTMANTSRVPYEELRCQYTIDTIPVVNDGYIQIESTDEDFYNVRIQDGIVDLGTRLEGLTLKDLPFGDLDHILNAQTFEDSFSNTSGYIYAYGNFGQGTDKVEFQAPSIFVHTIWEKIFASIGVQYEGPFFTTNEKYLNEVITPSIGFVPENTGTTSTSRGSVSAGPVFKSEISQSYIHTEEQLTFTGSPTNFTIVSGNIRADYTGRVELDISTTWSTYDTYLYFSVRVNGVSKASITLPQGGSQSRTDKIILNVETNDIISVTVYGSSYYDSNELDFFEVNYSLSQTIALNEITGGQFIEIADMIGDMSQIDFIKDIMNRYGLFITPVPGNTNAYRFRQIDNVLSDRDTAEDFTSKMVTYGTESYDSGLAKVNTMGFTYPDEVLEANNDGTLEIDNFNLEAEDEMFTSPFEIPVKVGTFKSEPLYSIPLFETGDEGIEATDTPNKLMTVLRKDTTVSFAYFNEATVNYTGSVPILSLDDINMQYYINNYYKQYRLLMNDYVERELELNLSPIDIANFRFDRLYYFSQLGRYCFFNEITYKAGTNAKCKIVEIRDFATNEPPETVGDYSFTMSRQGTKTITLANLSQGYYDPEFDDIKEVKILSGWGNEIEIRQNNVTITSTTIIPVENLDLTIVDTSTSTQERTHSFTYTLSDKGSGEFSSDTGTIHVTVNEYNNLPPDANAGPDQTASVNDESGTIPYININISGSASSDNTGQIVSYLWEVISAPNLSDWEFLYSTPRSTPSNIFRISNSLENVGTYTLRLTVTDEFGLSDTDTMEITINYDPGTELS